MHGYGGCGSWAQLGLPVQSCSGLCVAWGIHAGLHTIGLGTAFYGLAYWHRAVRGLDHMHVVACGQAGLCVVAVVQFSCMWLCRAGALQVPPQQMRAGTSPVQNKHSGRGHLPGHRGTHRQGCAQRTADPGGCSLGAPAGWDGSPGDSSFPAALPCRFLPSCSQAKFSPGQLTRCVLHRPDSPAHH